MPQHLNIRLKFNHIIQAPMLRSLFNKALAQPCLLCANHQGGKFGVCNGCIQQLPWFTAPQCKVCGLVSQHGICGACLSAPPSIDQTQAVFTYDYPLNHLLQQFKYQEALSISRLFAHVLQQKIAQNRTSTAVVNGINQPNIDLIIPMPMHPQRLKTRGFNQAHEIAKPMAKALQLPLNPHVCQRVKLTPPQASLPLKDRVTNIHGAFECKKNLEGLNIAIIDDVMTTGASLNELAKTLKKAGAARIECWVIARTLPR